MRSDVLGADLAQERAAAIRWMLRHPLLDNAVTPDGFRLAVRHHSWLTEWFEDTCGWQFSIDVGAGFARLRKRRAENEIDIGRPVQRLRGSQQPFDRRRYQLLCLIAAELVQHPVTTIGLLARSVTAHAALDTGRHGERAAFIDALRVLMSWGAVRATAGEVEDFITSEQGNAVLHAETTHLHSLIASTAAPSGLPEDTTVEEAIQALAREPRYGLHDDLVDTGAEYVGSGQRRRWVRHTLARKLLDDPVVYTDELGPAARDYLANPAGRGWLRARIGEAGLELEERSDGLLVVDASAVSTDIEFPAPHGNAHQLALLLADALLTTDDDGRTRHPGTLSAAELEHTVSEVFRTYPAWARSHRGAEGMRELTNRAVDLLEVFGLARRGPGGNLDGLPAIARYRVGKPTTPTEPVLFD